MHGGILNRNDDWVFTEWSIAGPEIALLISELQLACCQGKKFLKQSTIIKVKMFKNDLQPKPRHLAALQRNPFLENSNEILILYTKEVMPAEVSQSVMCAYEEGKKQHSTFVKERLESQVVGFHEPIKTNKIFLPSNRPKAKRSKHIDSIKDDMQLLGKLYISLQARDGNADSLFEVENTDAPTILNKAWQSKKWPEV